MGLLFCWVRFYGRMVRLRFGITDPFEFFYRIVFVWYFGIWILVFVLHLFLLFCYQL